MTHGTEHDTPAGDAADGVPGQAPAEGVQDGVPRPHTAPEGGDDAARPTGDRSTAEGPAADGTTGPTGDPSADERPAAAAEPRREAMTSWPSWDDVAVTAPPREERAPEAPAGTGRDASTPAAEATTSSSSASREDAATPAAATPAATTPADEAPAAEPAARATTAEPAAPALPPLSLSGLSALAYTALNAAHVGVPAHALASGAAGEARTDRGDGDAARADSTSADATPADAVPADAGDAGPQEPSVSASAAGATPAEPVDAAAGESQDATPAEAVDVTAGESPDATPAEAVDVTAGESPDATPAEPVDATGGESPDATAAEAVDAAAAEQQDATPAEPVDAAAVESPDAPSAEPVDAAAAAPQDATTEQLDDIPTTAGAEGVTPAGAGDATSAEGAHPADEAPAAPADAAPTDAQPADVAPTADAVDAAPTADAVDAAPTEDAVDAAPVPDVSDRRDGLPGGEGAADAATDAPVVPADAARDLPPAVTGTDEAEAVASGTAAEAAGAASGERAPDSVPAEPTPARGTTETERAATAPADVETAEVDTAASTGAQDAGTTTVLPSVPAAAGSDDDAADDGLETRATPVVLPPAWASPGAATAPTGAAVGTDPGTTSPGTTSPDPEAPDAVGRAGGDDVERPASPLDVFEDEQVQRRWPRVLAIVGGALVLVVGGYVGAAYALADRVPRGATVAGVEIGSMTSADAEQALAAGLAERATSPVAVVARDVQAELDPVAAGLTLDADATVARLTGVNLAQPVRVWRHVVGVGEQPPVTRVDETALAGALDQLGASLTLEPVDGAVVFADGAPHVTDAVDGWELDETAAAAVVEDEWLTASAPVELPTADVAPDVTQEEAERALADLARPLAAAPVTVRVGDEQAVLDVATLTAHASLAPVDGELQMQLDGEALSTAVLEQLPDLLTDASDARFEFQDGAPVIVPGTPGTTLDAATLATAVADAATAGTDRLATVELVESDPAETTEALEALGVKEIVSEFSTPLTSEPRRTANIANGLANITGTLVRPGETFSLTEALGPVDGAHGYVKAGAIVNGEHKDAWGGGLSQVSTTTYNAAYFAGFEDVEHTPHSEWFQRYPEGREATIFTGSIDMKWKNNTPYGALVQGLVADGRAHVRIWSTKHFTVETEKSGRSGVTAPTTVYSQSPTCEAQSAGNPGFTVTNTRRVYLDGQLVDTTSRTWRYKPQNKVVCGSAPAATPTP